MSGKALNRSPLKTPDIRMLNRLQAANYINCSVAEFLSICTVAPMKLGRNILWDRYALDEWLDGQTKGEANMTEDEWFRMFEDAKKRA